MRHSPAFVLMLLSAGLSPLLSVNAIAAFSQNGRGIYFSRPMTTESFADVPEGFQQGDLNPPSVMGFTFQKPPSGKDPGAWVDFYLGAPSFALRPLVGGGVGGLWTSGLVTFGLGGEFETYQTIGKAPVLGTHLDLWRWAAVAKVSIEGPMLDAGADFKWINVPDVTVAEFEGLPTKIGHSSTYLLRPWVQMNFFPIQARAALGIYSLGETAIASKEFAWGIGRQTVIRPELGAGIRLMDFEVWLIGALVLPGRDSDTIEYLEQAPFYYNDNLMARRTLSAEVRWNW